MPLIYLRGLTSVARTDAANRHLARYLAFVAGAANAGGFLAVHQYTSHMSGIVSAAADNLAAGSLRLVIDGVLAVLAFFSGAYGSTLLIRWGKSRHLLSRYALPLLSEAVLLTIFGLTGKAFTGEAALGTVLLLSFTMGLQNAMITKISGSVIRTTHLTGMITDLGIVIGRITSAASHDDVSVPDEVATLRLLASLVALFFTGGVIGALGYKHLGFLFTLPLALALLLLAITPVIDDLRGHARSAH